MTDIILPPDEPRKRGGQPGNKNALKHGFYAAPIDVTPLLTSGRPDRQGLRNEIAILRAHILRLAEQDLPQSGDDPSSATVRDLCLCMLTLNRLIRTHLFIMQHTTGGRAQYLEWLDQTLADSAAILSLPPETLSSE